MSALHRNALLDDGEHLLPENSHELLVMFQRIRRRFPNLTDEMNLCIDLLGDDGRLSEAFDNALSDYWRT